MRTGQRLGPTRSKNAGWLSRVCTGWMWGFVRRLRGPVRGEAPAPLVLGGVSHFLTKCSWSRNGSGDTSESPWVSSGSPFLNSMFIEDIDEIVVLPDPAPEVPAAPPTDVARNFPEGY